MMEAIKAMNYLTDYANAASFFAAFYACAGAICRLRHSRNEIKPFWVALYCAVFAIGAWSAADIIMVGIQMRDALTIICVGLYIRATSSSWMNGVPPIARRAA